MGNELPKSTEPPGKRINCLRYGGEVLLNQQIGTVYQQLLLEQRNAVRFTTLIEKRRKLSHPNLLSPRSFFTKSTPTQTFSCTSDKRTQIFIEYGYINRTLQDVIEEHSKLRKDIPQGYIYQIFGSVVEVLRYLENINQCHGDIKPSNILLDHIGSIKLIDSYFVSGGKTAYEIVMENPSSMSLLAPEQLDKIKNRQPEDLSTIHCSEMFAVGLSMLEAMTFQPAMECYDLKTLSIKPGYHFRKFQELSQAQYSQKLITLVMACISQASEKRPSFDQFLKTIRP